MDKYPGAVSTGGYPSLEMQQYTANKRTTAAISNTLRSADILDWLTRTGTYRAETKPRQLLIELDSQAAMLSGLRWFIGVRAQVAVAVSRGGAFTDLDVRIITAHLNGWVIPKV